MDEISQLRRDGLCVSQISALTGFDRKTVRKYLSNSRTPEYPKRAPRPSILDPYKEYISARLGEGAWNAEVLYQELRARGYAGGYTLVKQHLRPLREAARVVACRRFETPPGKQAQMDWGDLGAAPQPDGSTKKVYAFVMVLGSSRAQFAALALDQTLGTLMKMHEQAFEHLGGVPEQILYDNMKTVVLRTLCRGTDERGEIVWNPAFLDFARYWGFTPKLCRPYRPQTKGKVESGVSYLRKNFLCGRTVADLGEASNQLRAWLAEVANVRVHGTTHRVVREAWEEERAHLQPAGSRVPYPFVAEQACKVSRDAYVSFRTNRYPVPWEAAGASAFVRLIGESVHIYSQNKELAAHPLCTGRFQTLPAGRLHQGMPYGNQSRHVKNKLKFQQGAPEVEQRSLGVYEEAAGCQAASPETERAA